MKRTRQPTSSQVTWTNRLVLSFEETHMPQDMWKLVHAELDDIRDVLALGCVNVALYAAFGGVKNLIDYALIHGYHETITRARDPVRGDDLFHPLQWTVLTNGEHDDSLSLTQKLAFEMDIVEPKLRGGIAGMEVRLAGGFIRALMLRVLRRAGVATPASLSEDYTDIDAWFQDIGVIPQQTYHQLLHSIGKIDVAKNANDPVQTIRENTWSEKPVQCILAHLFSSYGSLIHGLDIVSCFDFTCSQAGVTFTQGEMTGVVVTPGFMYSLLTGCMFEAHPRPHLPYPCTTIAVPEWQVNAPMRRVSPKDKARLLSRFFKLMRLGYRDPTLSAFDVACMDRLFRSAEVQDILKQIANDPTDYLFL